MSPRQALDLFERMNPQAAGNPMMANLRRMVDTGDTDGIARMGMSLCESMGVSPRQVMEQARGMLPFA